MKFPLFLCLVLCFSGCTLFNKIQQKLGNTEPQAVARLNSPQTDLDPSSTVARNTRSQPSTAQTRAAQQPNTVQSPTPERMVQNQSSAPEGSSNEEYERLKKIIAQQQQTLQELQASQSRDRETIRQLEQTILTNFELLEHSVSESLSDVEQKLETVETNNRPRQSQSKTPSRTNSAPSQVSTSQQTARVASSSNSPPKPEPEAELIEDVSLFPKNSANTANLQKTSEMVENSPPTVQPVPVPLPPDEEIVDERRPVAQNRVVEPITNDIPAVVNQTKDSPYNDPRINEPASPYKLTSQPQVKKLYDQGMDAMINRRYKEAIETFRSMLKQFPNDDYSDNAQFWLGHVYYSVNQIPQAEQAFYKVLENYEHRPTSQGYKTPDAIYMLGKISMIQNQPKRSEYYFREVMKRFPGSTAASNSEEELKVLKNTQ